LSGNKKRRVDDDGDPDYEPDAKSVNKAKNVQKNKKPRFHKAGPGRRPAEFLLCANKKCLFPRDRDGNHAKQPRANFEERAGRRYICNTCVAAAALITPIISAPTPSAATSASSSASSASSASASTPQPPVTKTSAPPSALPPPPTPPSPHNKNNNSNNNKNKDEAVVAVAVEHVESVLLEQVATLEALVSASQKWTAAKRTHDECFAAFKLSVDNHDAAHVALHGARMVEHVRAMEKFDRDRKQLLNQVSQAIVGKKVLVGKK
jgi:hypothetical protein